MPNKYFDEIKKFKQLEPLISTMLAFSQKESISKQFDKKNSKPSFRKQGEASSKPKKNGSGLEGEHNLSHEERESIDKHEKKEKSPPRNRHAASEVKLKLELTDRRR